MIYIAYIHHGVHNSAFVSIYVLALPDSRDKEGRVRQELRVDLKLSYFL